MTKYYIVIDQGLRADPGTELWPHARMLQRDKGWIHRHLWYVTIPLSYPPGLRTGVFLRNMSFVCIYVSVPIATTSVSYVRVSLSTKQHVCHPGRPWEPKRIWPLLQMEVLFKMLLVWFLLTKSPASRLVGDCDSCGVEICLHECLALPWLWLSFLGIPSSLTQLVLPQTSGSPGSLSDSPFPSPQVWAGGCTHAFHSFHH